MVLSKPKYIGNCTKIFIQKPKPSSHLQLIPATASCGYESVICNMAPSKNTKILNSYLHKSYDFFFFFNQIFFNPPDHVPLLPKTTLGLAQLYEIVI
jgi:hypothetical protein